MADDTEKLDLRVYGVEGNQRAFQNIGGVLKKVSDTVLRQASELEYCQLHNIPFRLDTGVLLKYS